MNKVSMVGTLAALWLATAPASAACTRDKAAIAALDTEYQAAVQRKDVAAIDRLLADDFVLVTGKGKVHDKAAVLESEGAVDLVYERQDDSMQVVRLFGDTAIVTALLHAKGTDKGVPFEYRLWFSDVYLCTPTGWRYSFAQSSIPLPPTDASH